MRIAEKSTLIFLWMIFAIPFFIMVNALYAQNPLNTEGQQEEIDHAVEQLGTITFTVGVKIKGKIEKPQVVIFLPKGKAQLRTMEFTYSFREDINKPLPLESQRE